MLFFCGRNVSSTARSGQKGKRNKSFPKIQKFTAIKSAYLKNWNWDLLGGNIYVPSTTVSHREISWNPFNSPSMTWHFATSQELGAVSASKAKSPPGLGIIPNGFHVRSVQNLWIYTHNLKYTLGTSFFLDSPFEKSVPWNIMKSWSTCNTWDLDILGGEGLPRSQEIIRSHQDSNLSISSHVRPCPGHSPTSCRAHKAHRCMMYMALVVVAVTMGFAVCTRKLQAVGCCFFGIHTVHHTKRKAHHPHWDHEEHNQYDHPRDLLLQPYSHTQRSPFSPRRPHIPRFLRAWLKHISLCLMEPQHILQLHMPAMSTLQEVLLYFSGLLRYLHVSNSGKCGRVENKQHAPPRGVGNLIFFRYPRAFTIQDCLPSTTPPPHKKKGPTIYDYTYSMLYTYIQYSISITGLGYKTKTNNNMWLIGLCSFINHRDLHWTSRTTSLRLGGHAFQVFLGQR